VSDVTWLGESAYDTATGEGAVGVEFAGTAVSSSGQAGPILAAREKARAQVQANEVLQWQEGYYRGYYVLSLGREKAVAQYFGEISLGLGPENDEADDASSRLGSPSVATRNSWDLPLANFTVLAGKNHLSRLVAGGNVEAGFVRGGTTTGTNVTLDTGSGKWETIGFEKMFLK